MTTANKITLLRILLVPFFVLQVLAYTRNADENHRWLALTVFAIAAISDGIDGYLARHWGQKSRLGAFLDPLADKLLLTAGLVVLTMDHRPHLDPIHPALLATSLTRDVGLLIGWAFYNHFFGRLEIVPHLIGKAATVLQMSAILWCLFRWPTLPLQWIIGGATLATGISGVIYVYQGWKHARRDHQNPGPVFD